MAPQEVAGLQALAMKHGGSLTINPDTGLPEAGFLSKLLPMIAGFALNTFVPGLGTAIGGALGTSAAVGTGIAVGGLTGLASGSLSKGLMAGLGAYGGAGLSEGLLGAGAGTAASNAAAMGVEGAATGAGSQAAMLAEQNAGFGAEGLSRLADSAKVATGATPTTSGMLSTGLDAASKDPMAFAKSNWKPITAASLPVLEAITTTTGPTASPMAPGRIREKRWNGQYFEDVASTDAGVYNTSGRNFSDLYRGYNKGGIVALAEGGDVIRMAGGTPPAMLTDEQLYQKTGSWEAAAAARDQQNRALNIYNDAQRLATAVGATGPTQASVVPGVVDATKPGQYVTDPATGNAVALSAYSPGFDPNNKVAQTYLGELAAKGGQDTTSQMFNQMGASQAQQDTNAAAWAVEKARLDAIDAANAAKQPTGLTQLNQNLTNQNLTNQGAGLTAIPADASYTNRFFAERGLGFDPIDKAIDNFFAEYTDDLALMSPQAQEKVMRDALQTERMNEADVVRATGKTIAQLIQQKTGNIDTVLSSALPGGVSGGGNTVINPNGTVTTTPAIPGRPEGGFTGMRDVRDAYTQGGGSLGYTSPSFDTIEDFNKKYVTDRMTGDSLAAYEYLTGKKGASYPIKSSVGQIARPYDEAVLGYPARGNLPFTYDKATGKMVRNPDYVAPGRDAAGNVTYGMSINDIKSALSASPLSGQALYDWAISNGVSAQQIADATGRTLSSVYSDFRSGSKAAAKKKEDDKAAGINTLVESGGGDAGGDDGDGGDGDGDGDGDGGSTSAKRGGLMPRGYAVGGGLGSLGSYSDGGRLLKGPGDGVSDSIPATIGRKQQPARLADGEFVVPARIVSELGNGSTDAGARKLYAMMDRVQRARGKTTGKKRVAANTRADKYLPA
jgi:hypothetical protein